MPYNFSLHLPECDSVHTSPFRYRTFEGTGWTELPPTNQTVGVVKHLEAGEHYIIQVLSVSHLAERFSPQEVEQIIGKYNFLLVFNAMATFIRMSLVCKILIKYIHLSYVSIYQK